MVEIRSISISYATVRLQLRQAEVRDAEPIMVLAGRVAEMTLSLRQARALAHSIRQKCRLAI